MYISIMCTVVNKTAEIYIEVINITDYRHVHSSLENISLMNSVSHNADTVAKDTAVLYIAIMYTAVIYTVVNYT